MHAIPPPLLYGSGSKGFNIDLRQNGHPFAITFILIKIIYKRYGAEQNYGFLVMNGGSGWTRTTDLTLISSECNLRNLIKTNLLVVWYARWYARLLLIFRDSS